jgi:hypothetical protein
MWPTSCAARASTRPPSWRPEPGRAQRGAGRLQGRALQVLVATDLAARGIDIAQLPVVVNYDLPRSPGGLHHRIGRTGRAGRQRPGRQLRQRRTEAHFRLIEKRQGLRVPREQVPGSSRHGRRSGLSAGGANCSSTLPWRSSTRCTSIGACSCRRWPAAVGGDHLQQRDRAGAQRQRRHRSSLLWRTPSACASRTTFFGPDLVHQLRGDGVLRIGQAVAQRHRQPARRCLVRRWAPDIAATLGSRIATGSSISVSFGLKPCMKAAP